MDDRAFMEAIYANWSAGTVRYSAPAIVQAMCFICGGLGKGVVAGRIEPCRACCGKGYVLAESRA